MTQNIRRKDMVACIEANIRKTLHYLPFSSWRERQIVVFPILLNIVWRVSMYVQSDTIHPIPIKFDLDCVIPFLKMISITTEDKGSLV